MIDMYIIGKLEMSCFITHTTQEYTLLSDLLFIFFSSFDRSQIAWMIRQKVMRRILLKCFNTKRSKHLVILEERIEIWWRWWTLCELSCSLYVSSEEYHLRNAPWYKDCSLMTHIQNMARNCWKWPNLHATCVCSPIYPLLCAVNMIFSKTW